MRIIFDNNHVPDIGKYKDAVVEDQTNGLVYIYDCCGTYITIPRDLNYRQTFTNDDSITIEHNLGKYPAVTILNASGVEIEGDITHVSAGELTVTFSEPLTGSIVLN